MSSPSLPIDLEYLFSRKTRVDLEVIGETPEGIRVNVYTQGGEVHGPALSGRALPVGGDWFTLRRDGVGIVDARVTLETDSGTLIYMAYTGVVDMGRDAYERFLSGETPAASKIRICPRFQTADPAFEWLNRIQAVGAGENRPDDGGNVWDIYALR